MTVPLDRLSPPAAVAAEDFAALRDAALDRLRVLVPDYDPRPADPAVRLVEVAAYVRLLLGARINDAVKGTFLATARGADLDHVAAGMNVQRKAGEADDDLRRRAQLAWTALSVAGPRDAYRFHALSAAGVDDAAVSSPAPGEVRVVVLSDAADGGVGDAAAVAAVTAVLGDDTVRPMTDTVTVAAAALETVDVNATLHVSGQGPALDVVRAAAEAAVAALLDDRVIGRDIHRSALIAACHVPGVDHVTLAAPAADVTIDAGAAAVAGDVTLMVERA